MTDVLDATFKHGVPLVKLPELRKADPIGDREIPDRETVNVEVLNEIMDFIEAHPDTWYQESWYQVVDPKDGTPDYYKVIEEVEDANECNTAFCFAGHTAINQGFPFPKGNSGSWTRLVNGTSYSGDPMQYREYVEDFATKILGLSSEQADHLFHQDNTKTDLRNMVNALNVNPNFQELYKVRSSVIYTEDQLREIIAGEGYAFPSRL